MCYILEFIVLMTHCALFIDLQMQGSVAVVCTQQGTHVCHCSSTIRPPKKQPHAPSNLRYLKQF